MQKWCSVLWLVISLTHSAAVLPPPPPGLIPFHPHPYIDLVEVGFLNKTQLS